MSMLDTYIKIHFNYIESVEKTEMFDIIRECKLKQLI